MIKISQGQIITLDKTHRFQAKIGDDNVWFEFPIEQSFYNHGDALLSAALMPAMKKGEDIVLSDEFSVSPTFYSRIDELQSIFNYWFPGLFKKISITCRKQKSDIVINDTASFFSGGVDSLFTAINSPDINNLIFIHGVDMQLDNIKQFQQVLTANIELGDHLKKKLIPVISNVRNYITSHGFSWHYGQGGGLTSIGHLLGFCRTYIPSSDSIDGLQPFGSHPVTDPMWSSEVVQFVYHGMVTRYDKTRAIVKDPFVLDRIRVCWMDDGYNCGKCFKCIRTMTTLHLLDAKSKAFPEFTNALLANLKLYGLGELQYLNEHLAAAKLKNDFNTYTTINKKIKKLKAMDILRKIKNIFTAEK